MSLTRKSRARHIACPSGWPGSTIVADRALSSCRDRTNDRRSAVSRCSLPADSDQWVRRPRSTRAVGVAAGACWRSRQTLPMRRRHFRWSNLPLNEAHVAGFGLGLVLTFVKPWHLFTVAWIGHVVGLAVGCGRLIGRALGDENGPGCGARSPGGARHSGPVGRDPQPDVRGCDPRLPRRCVRGEHRVAARGTIQAGSHHRIPERARVQPGSGV
jgi:hypothetical protein